MPTSIQPSSQPTPEIRYQPSMLSIPSAAATVAPQNPPAPAPAPPRAVRRKLWFFVALSALVGVTSTAAIQKPSVTKDVRSGSPGFRRSSSGVDQHWRKRAVTVYLDGSLSRLGQNAGDAVMQAFGSWVESDPRLPDLTFDSGSTSAHPVQDGKSTVSYAEIRVPGHEKDIAITVSYANDKTGEILEADIVLNARYPMGVLNAKLKKTTESRRGMEAEDCKDRYDAQNVVTHEAGHFFGLGEDMVERDATMFLSIGQCEMHKRELAPTDVGAMTTLYAQVDSEPASGGPKACSFGPASRGGSAAVFAAVFGLSALRRRRRF